MKKRIVQVTVMAASLLVMIQTLYWPIIAKQPIAWWHSYDLAVIGRYVGFPIWILSLAGLLDGMPRELAMWVLMFAWAGFLSWLAGRLVDLARKRRA